MTQQSEQTSMQEFALYAELAIGRDASIALLSQTRARMDPLHSLAHNVHRISAYCFAL